MYLSPRRALECQAWPESVTVVGTHQPVDETLCAAVVTALVPTETVDTRQERPAGQAGKNKAYRWSNLRHLFQHLTKQWQQPSCLLHPQVHCAGTTLSQCPAQLQCVVQRPAGKRMQCCRGSLCTSSNSAADTTRLQLRNSP